MSLLRRAEEALELTLEDKKLFGKDIIVTDPAGQTATVSGQVGDIYLLYDNDAGQVSNRTVHISLRISTLSANNFSIPKEISDESQNPWIFEFADISGQSRKFTVAESRPDRTLGIVTIILELLKDE